MKWLDLVSNAQALKAIFGDLEPTLDVVDLHEVVINRDGPTIKYRFDLIDYPENPPLKWVTANYNRVQLELSLFDVKGLVITGFSRRMEARILLKRNTSDYIVFSVIGQGFRHTVETEFADISKISAYRNGN